MWRRWRGLEAKVEELAMWIKDQPQVDETPSFFHLSYPHSYVFLERRSQVYRSWIGLMDSLGGERWLWG
jgi:hypothetical protein